MEKEQFKELVLQALEDLPPEIRRKMDNIEIILEDFAKKEVLRRLGKSSPLYLLGLYQGIPLRKRGVFYGNVLPDRIIIYQKPIELISRSDHDLKEKIKDVVLHEIGHYFGLSEDELRKR